MHCFEVVVMVGEGEACRHGRSNTMPPLKQMHTHMQVPFAFCLFERGVHGGGLYGRRACIYLVVIGLD